MRPAILGALLLCPLLLSLGGCSNAGGLFSNDLFGNGASALADHGSDIFSAASKAFSGPSYCQKAGSTEVYKVEDGGCAAADTAIKSWEYNDRLAQNEAETQQQLHAAAQAAAAKPTYCRTVTSHTAYRPLSGQCQAREQTISQEEYDAAKAEAAAAWTKVP